MKTGRSINQFTIKGKTYSIRLTKHAELRLTQRKLDLYQAIGAILSLGKNRITEYAGSNRDIMILDKVNNFAVVINIKYRTIIIVTVIDKADCWVKKGTDVINL
jgi:hypothetical protein